MNEKSITSFLASEYKEFAMYSIESRAIPSVIDSFKPVQRKIIHVSNQIWKTGAEKKLKVFQLAGKVASDAFYHHGNASLENAIITMGQRFKNNAPLLEAIGQWGSLRSPEAGAPRYIETKLTDNFRLLYKDFELLDYKEEDGEVIEPKFFLPIIPTILVNGVSGMGVGFASDILNRNPKDVIDACIKILEDKKMPSISPKLQDFTGEFIIDPEKPKRWIIRGLFERVNTSTVKINELPPSLTLKKYEEILDDLVEKKLIVSYDDNCKGNINITVKFTRSDLEKLDDERLIKLLKLEEYITEIYTTLDENGKLKIFESVEEIVNYFVRFRLGYYHKRKEFMLNKMQHELTVLANRGKFIKAILDGKIIVNNVPKSTLISNIEAFGLVKIEDSYDYLLRMPIYSLTIELYEKLKEDFKSKKEEIEVLKNTDPKNMYLLDLGELKKKFK